MYTVTISVILATYNGNKVWISEAIDSVLLQDYRNFEFIIINDASTNEVEKTILEYKQKDDRIIYIKNEKNLERSASRNKGIGVSKGKYIVFIDDDDIWCDPEKLKKQVEFMDHNPTYGLCGTGVILIDENGKEINRFLNRIGNDVIRKYISGSNQFAFSSTIVRKETLSHVGLFNDHYYLAEDYDLWLRIGKVSKFNNLREYCLKYRVRNGSTTGRNNFKLNMVALKIYLKHRNDYLNKISGIIKHLMNIFMLKKAEEILVKIYKK